MWRRRKKEVLIIKKQLETESLNGIYKSIAQVLSVEECLILYQNFKGLSVTFPTKLVDPEYIKKFLNVQVMSGTTITKKDIQKLALHFDYSERQIRRFLKEAKETASE